MKNISLIFIFMGMSCSILFGKVLQDYCPIALGNWWEYEVDEGIRKSTITSLDTVSPGEYSFKVTDSLWTKTTLPDDL
jgi:hypothetical protein